MSTPKDSPQRHVHRPDEASTGTFKVDTVRIRALREDGLPDEINTVRVKALGADLVSLAAEPKIARRRTLDDMRKLSEEIVAAQKPDQK